MKLLRMQKSAIPIGVSLTVVFGACDYFPTRTAFAGDLEFNNPMTFNTAGTGGNCNGCEWIAAEGNITVDTPEQFANFISEKLGGTETKYEVAFNSPGGNLLAGVSIGPTTMFGRSVR